MMPALKESGYKVYRTIKQQEEEKQAVSIEEEYE
jgi:hypothetical protein